MNTTYFLNLIAGNVFGTDKDPVIPTAYYLGLSTTTPTTDGGNVSEPATSKGYKRMPLAGNLSAPNNGVISNKENILFDESTASWGEITHYCIFDAASGGKLLMYGALSTSRTVEANTVMVVKGGSLKLSVVNS